jgi:hypothetical protein
MLTTAKEAQPATRSWNLDHSKQQQDDHDEQDEADAAPTVITDARAKPITAKTKNQQQDNQDQKKHTFSFALKLLPFSRLI